MLYWQFRKALLRCQELNSVPHNGGKYIVANICGKPVIINRQGFRELRTKDYFRRNLKWQDVYAKQVTEDRLRDWIC